ncbi:hypothetical protein, partial [Paenirhodobacter sp. CAU 1674]|uniref:hypothetical protein n=1 Tax=Paenirhodobacter sp. CAU 1674 TaxID=3032596 RepID=UPI0023D9D4E0
LLLDHPDNLRLGETAFSHSSAPSELAQTLHYVEGSRGGQVMADHETATEEEAARNRTRLSAVG